MAQNELRNQHEHTLADKLSTKQASLDQHELPGLSDFVRCPVLEDLQIGRADVDGTRRELPTLLDIYVLQHYMEQPCLKELTLLDIKLIDEEEGKKESSYPALENANPLCHLSTLNLRQIQINPATLTKLFRMCSGLRNFTLTRPIGSLGGILLHDLALALRTVSHYLHTLTLGYSGGHKPPEITLLPPLRNMSALVHLKVDPTMYLGRRLCPDRFASQPIIVTRPASSFADLLPNGLETLTLDIDIEQVWRLPGYRRDIVKSIVDARAHLLNLKEITLFEDEGTCLNACSCGRCYAEMSHIWRGNRRNADETQERRDAVKMLRKLGIKLFRDIANGQGRYECTAWGNA